ncbi:MAG: hypothetical protein JNK72_25030 [Myxococcales bacterium]|nr:hypothetical protein [Myxococcales bacterium]
MLRALATLTLPHYPLIMPPKPRVVVLDQKAHAAAKQAARDKDSRDLEAGLVTNEELARRNGIFSGLKVSFTMK